MLGQLLALTKAEDHRLQIIVVEQCAGQDTVLGRFDFFGEIDDVCVVVAHLVLASSFPANLLFLELYESGLLVGRHGSGMIQRAGLQPEPVRLVAPRFLDGPLQEPPSQPSPDEVGHQTELNQLHLLGLPDLPLCKLLRRTLQVTRIFNFVQTLVEATTMRHLLSALLVVGTLVAAVASADDAKDSESIQITHDCCFC